MLEFTPDDVKFFYGIGYIMKQDSYSHYYFVKNFIDEESEDSIDIYLSIDRDIDDDRKRWKYKCRTLDVKYYKSGYPFLNKTFFFTLNHEEIIENAIKNEEIYKKFKKEKLLYKIKHLKKK